MGPTMKMPTHGENPETIIRSVGSSRFSSIQIARAFAALSVLLFHSHFVVASFQHQGSISFFSAYGSFGVDLFFVVSEFIIAHIAGDGQLGIGREYFVKRFFRIYPLYWMFLNSCSLSAFRRGLQYQRQ